MDIRAEIADRAKLSPEMQEQVLLFVSSLGTDTPKGRVEWPYAGSRNPWTPRLRVK